MRRALTGQDGPFCVLDGPRDEADVQSCERLLVASFPSHLTCWTDYGTGRWAARIAGRLPLEVKNGGSRLHIAVAGGEVLGFAEWRDAGGRLFLNHIYVRAGMRGQGIGRLLLSTGLSEYASYEDVCLDVFAHNLQVFRWYESLGLTRTLEFDWWVRDGAKWGGDTTGRKARAERESFPGGLISEIDASRYRVWEPTLFWESEEVLLGRIPSASFLFIGQQTTKRGESRGVQSIAKVWRLTGSTEELAHRLGRGGERSLGKSE